MLSIMMIMQVARGKTDFCAAHGGGMKCRAENCMKAAGGKYFYCKEHLRMFGGAEEDIDDIEEDELYHGIPATDAEIDREVENTVGNSLGKRPYFHDDTDNLSYSSGEGQGHSFKKQSNTE